jgi:putative inorganic carbon (hco3(-)) transporter
MIENSIYKKLICIPFCIYLFTATVLPGRLKIFGSVNAADLLLLVTLLYYLIAFFLGGSSFLDLIFNIFHFLKKPLIAFMLLLGLVMVVSVSFAPSKGIALNEALRFFTYLSIGYIILSELNSTIHIRYIISTFLLSTTLLVILGGVQYFTRIGVSVYVIIGGFTPRLETTFGNPNSYAAFLVVAVFPCIMLFIQEKAKLKKLFYFLLSAGIIVNLVLTYSRNSWLAFAIGLLLLVFIYNWKFIFLMLAGGGASLLIPQVSERIRQFGDTSQNQGRIYIWKIALEMIKEHPLKGIGNGNFTVLYDSYVDRFPQYRMEDVSAFPSHNSYLKVQSELGILGSIPFLLILWVNLKNLIFILKNSDGFYRSFYLGLLVSTICMLLLNVFDNILFVPQVAVVFWYLAFTAEAVKQRLLSKSL